MTSPIEQFKYAPQNGGILFVSYETNQGYTHRLSYMSKSDKDYFKPRHTITMREYEIGFSGNDFSHQPRDEMWKYDINDINNYDLDKLPQEMKNAYIKMKQKRSPL